VEVTFSVPPVVAFGAGALNELPVHARRLRIERALIVTDKFFAGNGVADRVAALLAQSGIQSRVFDNVQPDPTVANVQEGLAAYNEFGADALVAVGGGSPIDAAKAISVLTGNPEPLSLYHGYHKVPRQGAPVIAIPTTAGTGSEVTKVTVITDTERDIKMMMLDVHLLPAVAIVDYELSMTMPPDLTAHVGVDTLTHGIEAYVSRRASPMTDPLALSCIQLVGRHLLTAWREPNNREARAAMALAATQGGMAFPNSSVCLVHGMSRPIGAIFHVAHGLSNAILLPVVTRFSLPGALDRYATIARVMHFATADDDDETAGVKLVEGLRHMNEALGVPRLGQCKGVTRERFDAQVERMAQDALASGSPGNNPVVPTAAQIVELYREAW
jgi:alcohol dehydrogenase class IV